MTPCYDYQAGTPAFPYRAYRTAFVTGAALTRGKRASTARRLSLTNVFPGGIRTRDRLPTQRHLPCQPCAHRAFHTPDSRTRCHRELPQRDDWHHRLWCAMQDSNLRPWD